jgi:hypothetical protein
VTRRREVRSRARGHFLPAFERRTCRCFNWFASCALSCFFFQTLSMRAFIFSLHCSVNPAVGKQMDVTSLFLDIWADQEFCRLGFTFKAWPEDFRLLPRLRSHGTVPFHVSLFPPHNILSLIICVYIHISPPSTPLPSTSISFILQCWRDLPSHSSGIAPLSLPSSKVDSSSLFLLEHNSSCSLLRELLARPV